MIQVSTSCMMMSLSESLLPFATLSNRRDLEPKFVPQLIVGSLLGIYLSLSLVTVPEVLARTRFHLVFKVAKDERDVKLR